MKSRNFFKKGIIWTLVVSLLFGTVVMTATTVAGESTVGIDAAKNIKEAVEDYMIASTFFFCTKHTAGIDRGELDPEEDIDDLFDPDNTDGTVYVGAWVQGQMSGKATDGRFDCNGGEYSDVVGAFSKMLGLQEVQILCNLDDTRYPGLITYYNTETKQPEFIFTDKSSGGCKNYGNDSEYVYTDYSLFGNISDSDKPKAYGETYSTGQEYIQILYNHWREEKIKTNPFIKEIDINKIVGFDSIFSRLTDAEKYLILFNDYSAACYGAESAEGANGVVKIKKVDEDTSITDWYTSVKGSANKQYGVMSTMNNAGNWEGYGCADFPDKIGLKDSDYRNKYLVPEYEKECNSKVSLGWEQAKAKAKLIADGKEIITINGTNQQTVNKEYSQEQKEEANDFLKKYNYYNKNYAINTGEGLKCVAHDGTFIEASPYIEDVTTGTAIDSCQSNAGALGWIICNVLEMAGSAAESAYESFLKPQLEVNPVLIGATGNNSTANAWAKFQGFANIIFVIVFLVIIFSQLTGYGIDNYGIKKILPKLVVTVILVNLSFVICQVAVDLSNILGNSLQKLFSSIDIQNMTLTETFEGTTDTFQISAETQTLLWVVLVGVLVGGGIAIWRNPALLISLLVSVLGVLIAGFFVFILLAARQAAIVVLIVLSPLAFVCYALPNTKKLFDKWLKLMQSLLLVYPICGLLIGGGDFASRLLLSAGLGTSFAAGLTAMLVGIVPIFFIPTVLKNSMSALGGLGAKISGLGNKVGGGAKSTLRNTRAYKNAQERGKARGDRKFAQARAGVHLDKKTGEFVNNRSPIARLRRRAAGSRVGQFFGADAAMGEQQAKLRGMEEKRQQNAMTAEVGIAPLVNADNLRQKMQNAISEAIADNKVPVVPVNVDLAVQRRKSANEAQELKNYTDQFAGYTRDQLKSEAEDSKNWLSQEGGTQRMQALLSAMESQGMEKDMAKVLEDNGDAIGNNAKIMQTLAGSKNKVFKAYGKAGNGQSYEQFMSGTGNGKSLAKYVEEKGTDFLNGLDDKALMQINKYQTKGNDIMSGDLLAQAASQINSQDATDEIDKMIKSRIERGEKVEFSAAQYANLNNSTQEMLDSLHRSGNSSVGDNLIRISNDMINAPEQYAKLKFNEKDADGKGENGSGTYLNEARARAGLGTMQDAIQSLHVPHNPQPNSGGAS